MRTHPAPPVASSGLDGAPGFHTARKASLVLWLARQHLLQPKYRTAEGRFLDDEFISDFVL